MRQPKNIKNLPLLPVSLLRESFLGKETTYTGEGGTLKPYRGIIINIAYYKGLEGPWCEVELKLWKDKTTIKMLPLAEMVLNYPTKLSKNTFKKSNKSIAA